MAQFRAGAPAHRNGQRSEQGRHGGHHDGTEAQQASFPDRILRTRPARSRLDGKIDHHDGVLLDDAHQQDDADDGDDGELDIKQMQNQQRTEARRRQTRQNRDRVDETLVQNAEHDIDRENGCQDQQRLIAE